MPISLLSLFATLCFCLTAIWAGPRILVSIPGCTYSRGRASQFPAGCAIFRRSSPGFFPFFLLFLYVDRARTDSERRHAHTVVIIVATATTTTTVATAAGGNRRFLRCRVRGLHRLISIRTLNAPREQHVHQPADRPTAD